MDSEDDDCFFDYEQYINPLDIPYVLQTVLKNLSVWNLRKCRLVCKYWESEATPILRRRSKITIKHESDLTDLTNIEFPHFAQSFDIKPEVKLKKEATQLFFKNSGCYIKSLDISFHYEYGNAIMATLLSSLCQLEELCLNGRAHFLYEEVSREFLIGGFPKLKCLFIYDSSFDLNGFEPRRIWAENVFHILAGSPLLEKVYYAPFLETRAKMFFEILNCVPTRHQRLSHLHINHLWTNFDETRSLVSKKYQLKYVHLVLTSQLAKASLYELLFSLHHTLRELTLTFTDGTTCLEFHPIGPLDKLTKLSMIGYDGPLLVNHAPELKLFVMSLPECNISPANVLINPDLEELEIYDFQAKYNINYLRALFLQFSHLKTLRINNVNNDILRAVYTYLPCLSELKTCFHKFYGIASSRIDCGLNGLSPSQLDEELLDMWDDRGVSHLRVNPWIGLLSNLKHLTLEVGLISDFGIILGIARCKSLQELSLKNTNGNNNDMDIGNDNNPHDILTDRSLRVLTEDMNLFYLKIEGFSKHFSANAMECARESMEGREFSIVD